MKKLIALLLCVALGLSLFGCAAQTVETTPPTTLATQPPTEPDAGALYEQARQTLDSAGDIALRLLVTTTVTVGGETFTEESTQSLTYEGRGTDDLRVRKEEALRYGLTDGEESVAYSEIYADGTVYAALGDSYRFSGTLEVPESRYLPPVLLDAALYGSVTEKTSAGETTVTFAQPSAAEAWAMPQDGELVDASGTAVLDAAGAIQRMNYTITYHYGPGEIRLEVQSEPTEGRKVVVPEDAGEYSAISCIDALRLFPRSTAFLLQADAISTSSMQSIFTQAAGVLRNQSTTMDLCGRGADTMTKIQQNVFFMDYSTLSSQELKQEELYVDGKYTVTVDDGTPTHYNIPAESIRDFCTDIALGNVLDVSCWQEAGCTDLGSLLLMEFTFTPSCGDQIQNEICTLFWEDPSFLNKLASAYVTNEMTGYLALDKYTGLPTATGYCYEGTHTIDGQDYVLSMQVDQSIETPSKGAYFAITEEMPPEEAPETGATPLFYHVTGSQGQEMWLLGTIHVGDERTAYLPQEIYDAFAASDALALEINSKAFEEQVENDDAIQDQVSDAYYYGDGTTVESLMEEGDYANAVRYMKATGNYNMNTPYMKPSMWSQAIENFYLRQGYALHGDQGVEERLHQWAQELEKPIREVESSLFQIRMMTSYSNDLQLLLLDEALSGTAEEYWQNVGELYEAWCAGDEADLKERINEEPDLSELTEEELAEYEANKPLYDEYNQAMLYDRNEGMLKVAVDYLESGDVVFYAVGLAHLLDATNGLVEALRNAGYTVELVRYGA